MTRRVVYAGLAFALLAGCAASGGFAKVVGVGRYPPLPPSTPIGMAATVAELPQPAEVLGDLRLPSAAESRSVAQSRLLDLAAKNGCDAIAEVRVVTPEVASERAHPDTLLWDVLLAATNELLWRRSEDPAAIVGRVLAERPLKAGVPTYVPGAGRALQAEVEAGGVRGVLQFAAEY